MALGLAFAGDDDTPKIRNNKRNEKWNEQWRCRAEQIMQMIIFSARIRVVSEENENETVKGSLSHNKMRTDLLTLQYRNAECLFSNVLNKEYGNDDNRVLRLASFVRVLQTGTSKTFLGYVMRSLPSKLRVMRDCTQRTNWTCGVICRRRLFKIIALLSWPVLVKRQFMTIPFT